MGTSWRAGLWLDGVNGGTPLQVTDDDVTGQAARPALGQLRLLAPFSIAESIDDELWPAQPRQWGRFSLLANTAAELGGIVRGVECAMAWKGNNTASAGRSDWDMLLWGVVDTARIRPWWSGGVVGEFTVLDRRLGKLGRQDAGTTAYPQEACSARLARLLGTAGLDYSGPGPTPAVDPNVKARPAERSTTAELVERLLRQWVDTDGGPVGRPIVMPVKLAPAVGDTTGLSGAFRWWEVGRQLKATDPDYFAAVRTADGDAVAGEVTIPAELVEFTATFDHQPNSQPTKVSATWDNAGTQATESASNADHTRSGTTAVIETDLQGSGVASRVAKLYLPDNGLSDWQADTFAYRLDRSPTDDPVVPRVGQVVVVDGLLATDSPDGATSYVGRLSETELLVEAGQVVQTLALRPAVQTFPAGTTTFYFDSTASSGPTVVYSSFWERSTDALAMTKRTLRTDKTGLGGSTSALVTANETSATNPYDVALAQYLSAAFTRTAVIPAGTDLDVILRGLESAAAADAYVAVSVRAVDAAGVEQVVLYENAPTAATELPTATAASRWVDVVTTERVTMEAGWRLVVELGVRFTNAVTTAYNATLRLPSTTAADFIGGGATADLSPFLRLGRDLT